MIAWLIASAKFRDAFWCINFTEWIKIIVTIILGYVVAYLFVERSNKKRNFNELIVAKIERLIKKLDEDCIQILSAFTSKNWVPKLLASTKDVSNNIELLKKYEKDLKAEKELAFISEQFAEYRTYVTECTEKLRNDAALRDKAILKIGLITNELSKIELKIYE